MQTSNGSSQFLEKLKAIEASRAGRKAWKRIYDLVPQALKVLAKAQRDGKLSPQETTEVREILESDWVQAQTRPQKGTP